MLSSQAVASDSGYTAPWETLPPTPQLPKPKFQGQAGINGMKLWYATFGPSPRVSLEKGISPGVFLHGGGINSNWWGHQIKYLKERVYSVIAIDSRAHGRSTDDLSQPLSYDALTEDVIALMDELYIPRFSVVGWSDGAILGLNIAMNYTGHLDRLFSFGATYDVSNANLTGAAGSKAVRALIPRREAEYKVLSPTPDQFETFLQRKDAMQASEPTRTASSFQKIPILYTNKHAPMIWIVTGDSEELVKRNVPGEIHSFIWGSALVTLPLACRRSRHSNRYDRKASEGPSLARVSKTPSNTNPPMNKKVDRLSSRDPIAHLIDKRNLIQLHTITYPTSHQTTRIESPSARLTYKPRAIGNATAMGNTTSSHKISAQDKAILDLKNQRDKLHQYQKRITVLTDRETAIARECLARGDRERALLALRRKKYQQSLLSKTDAQLEQLERLTGSVEFALVQKDVLFGLSQGTKVLHAIHREMGGLEGVEKMIGETEEARAYQEEISRMLGGQISNQDEDEVEDELEALEQEVAGPPAKLPDAPTSTLPDEVRSKEERARERKRERAKARAAMPMEA
ncbi:hypothetical protein AJ80_04223 [Polytolypa hystricis UAMH7299]|uniref:AB hydrolase-1 domain-containing protein n=1 Tax=Polytolypa hystricis (strain UAMH7299) TaxID=1447883 RepID=A0A2B7Y4S4_POLH7|nr:hypothetical protein AJ80_04223 [Polytolypa hystricis UAMH7299]